MLINRSNYEEFFLLYIDGELNETERLTVEKFVSDHPDLREELDVLRDTVLVSDSAIVFENKQQLYKTSANRRLIFYWYKIAAAIIVILGIGLWGYRLLNKADTASLPTLPVAIHHQNENPTLSEDRADEKREIKDENEAKEQEVNGVNGSNNSKKNPVQTKDSFKKTHQSSLNIQSNTTIAESKTPEVDDLYHIEQKNNLIELAKDFEITGRDIPENDKTNLTNNHLQPEVEQLIRNHHTVSHAVYADEMEHIEESDDEVIYFANTTISKKNSLRGVIRKATRIIDRVTSSRENN